MSHKLINLSPDLKKLRDEGFEIEIKGGYLLVSSIPYVDSSKEVKRGTLVSKLDLAGDKTTKPGDHVIYFIGDYPCNKDGSQIKQIQHATQNQDFGNGILTNHSFSNKPTEGYLDYYEKIVTYTKILSSQAQAIDPDVKAMTFKVIQSVDTDSVFHYFDTNSSRAEINLMASKLENLKIAIVGLGGTGSYILDLITKTPVKEIHIFDGDTFLQHNAFRAPGAASKEKIEEQQKKVLYQQEVYSKMYKYIIPYDHYLDSSNIEEVCGVDFVFICIDEGNIKKSLIEKLIAKRISFIDTGIGVEIKNEKLRGSVRVTAYTGNKEDHISKRISFSDGNDEYSTNIQIAELNALNAALAVIKWKKIYGFYHDLERECNMTYNIDVNQLLNEDLIS